MKRSAVAVFLVGLAGIAGIAVAGDVSQVSGGLKEAVQEFVKANVANNDGAFTVHDPQLKKDWRLRALKLRLERKQRLSDTVMLVPAEGEEIGGKTKITFDLQFELSNDSWAIKRLDLRSVDGIARGNDPQKAEKASCRCSEHHRDSTRTDRCPECGMASDAQ